jgi:hypothetical protein
MAEFGAVSALQFQQNLSPDFGGVPQATHITAFSDTSFPQFLQYIFFQSWVILLFRLFGTPRFNGFRLHLG